MTLKSVSNLYLKRRLKKMKAYLLGKPATFCPAYPLLALLGLEFTEYSVTSRVLVAGEDGFFDLTDCLPCLRPN
jgi:hypothetical protein